MYRTATRQTGRKATFKTVTVKAPTGGLNARDSIADMPPGDAPVMLNWWPTTLDVVLRNGYENHSTGIGNDVETLIAYNKADGTKELFAAADEDIFDVTSSGAVGAAAVTGLTNAQWQYIQFSTSGGTFLEAVNGADDLLLYDGTTWTPIDGASSPAITGVTTSTLININLFKNRVWFVQKDTLVAWYLAAGSISGSATAFDLRGEFRRGGYLVAMATWSLDAGEGMDDYAVFITSEGEIAVYKGTDPAAAATFAKVGTFQIANPIGYRCFEKFGGDIIVITRDGLLPLSKALLSDRVSTRIALTDKVNSAITTLTAIYGDTFGWQVQLFPQQNMLILNVPVTNTKYQFAMNTITQAWTLFKGWNSFCWARSGEDVYFGGDGIVGKIWDAQDDEGSDIVGDAVQAFSLFGSNNTKYFKMAKPIIATNGSPGIGLNMLIDYNLDSSASGTPTISPSVYGLWDVGVWDAALWGGAAEIKTDWQTVGAIGTAAAINLRAAAQGMELKWEATQYVFEVSQGTIL